MNDQLTKQSKVFSHLRTACDDVPISHIEVLLMIIIHDGVAAWEISDRLGIRRSTLSRMLHEFGRDGFNLIEQLENNQDRRMKKLYPTAKGKQLAKTIIEIMEA